MSALLKKIILLFIAISLHAQVFAAIITVRLIKGKPSRCSAQPTLQFLSGNNAFVPVKKAWYNGESDLEIFFEVETNTAPFEPAKIEIYAPGVEIVRAIIGRTDVSFTKQADKYALLLVQDTTDGRHVTTTYQNPSGGAQFAFYHNWKYRVSGRYANIPYPEKELAASANYALACQEMLRIMGGMNGDNQKFNGEFHLINCESSAPRAHHDFPPHWHLQHWEHDYTPSGEKLHRKKQYIIPHYYLDSLGNILSNTVGITQNYVKVKLEKTKINPGDTASWKDVEGNLIFNQVIKNGGLEFIKPNGEKWSLRPDKEKGGQDAVWIYKLEEPVARVTVRDDGAKGETNLEIVYYEKNNPTRKWSDHFNYDPFTGKSR